VNIAEVFEKRLTVTGSSLRTREIAYKKLLAKRLRDEIWPLLEAGEANSLFSVLCLWCLMLGGWSFTMGFILELGWSFTLNHKP
jgi:hypothetical protein